MTREEAIKWLIKPTVTSTEVSPTKAKELEAYDMAIEALSADTVSREAHYDAVANRITDMEERGFVSVVRCKDCRYYWGNLSEDDTDEMYGECRWNSDEMPNDDDFCSYGERAEQTEYKLPGHDEVMEALDKMTLRGDKDE